MKHVLGHVEEGMIHREREREEQKEPHGKKHRNKKVKNR